MVKELMQAVTLLFRRTGMSPQTRKHLVMIASMENHWFSPTDSEILIDRCIEMNLLKEMEDGTLMPNINIHEQDVPIDFSPGKEILQGGGDDLFMRMVETISMHTEKEHAETISEINEYQERFHVAAEAAAMFVGRLHGAPVEGMYDDVDRELVKRAKEME